MEQKMDKQIECIGCGDTFTWSVKQQEFYEEHYLIPPKRCLYCRREMRRKRREIAERRAGEVRHDR